MSEPTVCAKAIRPPMLMAALRTGRSVPDLAAEVCLPPGAASDMSLRLPHSTVVRVWEHFATTTQEDDFGLVAAEFLGAAPQDLVDHAILRAPTLREVVARFAAYQALFHDANDARIFETGHALEVRQGFSTKLPRSRHLIEFILAMWAMRTRMAMGRNEPLEVSFRHAPPRETARHRALFGAEVHFGANADALFIPRAWLDVPLSSAVISMEHTRDAVLGKSAKLSDRVHVGLVAAIGDGHVDIDAIARSLALSRRTLQRRLAEEGLNFREALDRARREVALDFVVRKVGTVTDLTFLLGFSDTSAFSRAFRRWTGTSPSRYVP